MIARKCDACDDLLDGPMVIHLIKKEIKDNMGDNQIADEIHGDYCKTCLENGDAIKDLLHGTDK